MLRSVDLGRSLLKTCVSRLLPVPVLTLLAIGVFLMPSASASAAYELKPNSHYMWYACLLGRCPEGASVDIYTNARGKISHWKFFSLMRAPRQCRDGARAKWTGNDKRVGKGQIMRARKNGSVRFRAHYRHGKFRVAAKVSKDGSRISGNYTLQYSIQGYSRTCSSKPVKFVAKIPNTGL